MARMSNGESVLSRVIRIFDAFDPQAPTLTVGELARRADLPLATTSRLVSELVESSWLFREGRSIRVGARMWELGAFSAQTPDLRRAATPYMEDLHSVVGHHVQLGVLENREVLFIEQLSAPDGVRSQSRFGGRLPLHTSAAGLLLLAYSPTDLQEAVLAKRLPTLSRHTVTEPSRLRHLLSEIRRREYLYCTGFDEGAVSAAAPVRDRSTDVVAALSVTVPDTPSARSAIPALIAAARGISRTLGNLPGGVARAAISRTVS